jgi:hypothetical protein
MQCFSIEKWYEMQDLAGGQNITFLLPNLSGLGYFMGEIVSRTEVAATKHHLI